MSSPGTIRFVEINTTPAAPPAGSAIIYVKTDNVVYLQDSNGIQIALGTASGITSLVGEATGTGPGAATITLSNSAVIGKVLSGFVSGPNSVVLATDTILQAMQKLQAQVSAGSSLAVTSLTGDVTGTGPGATAATVALVGGKSASAVSNSVDDTQNATALNTASRIVKRDASGNFSANVITASLTGNASTATTATSFSGSLVGDVTGTQGATTVASVGGKTSSAVSTAVDDVQTATSSNTASKIVKRDASGNFSANVISAALTGVASGNELPIVATTSADYYRGDKTFQPLNKAAVGLSAVDNTSDANKPVSSAQQTALNLKEDLTNKATSLASPDNTKYPTTLAVSNAIGAIVSGVSSFNTRTGAVLPQSGDYTKSDVGLGNVDNTSDANKPVSTAQAAAIGLKVDKAGDTLTGTLSSDGPAGSGYYNSLITTCADTNGLAQISFDSDTFKRLSIGIANSLFSPVIGILPDYSFQHSNVGHIFIADAGFKWVQGGSEGASLAGGALIANTSVASPIVRVTAATASRVAVLDASKNVVSSSVSTTTLGYLDATSSVQTQINSKVAKAGDTMTDSLTITGNNGLEFAGLKVNNTNTAGFCAINARADDGEVIQIAALNSGGAANAYGMWTANQFGLYSKRSLNIMTDTAGAEIKFATGTGGTQIAKFDSVGKFHCNGINLVSGTVENVPTPTAETHAANKAYADSVSIINALIFG